tara:strand:+ start:160 stop:429 length:270 start_codon:yes stop_codon:yes gene_type:complete
MFLQVADIWTTKRGLNYDCVFEVNPLLPEVPHKDRLILHKLVFLFPMNRVYNENALSNGEMIFPLLATSYVVDNNLKVINDASRICEKR